MLSIFLLLAVESFHIRRFAGRIAKTRLRRRFVFKDFCDDRVAHRLHDYGRRMDAGDDETAKPFDFAPDIFCATCLCAGNAKSRRVEIGGQFDARRIQTTERLADSGFAVNPKFQMPDARRRILCVR